LQDYRNLKVWTKAHQLALLVYETTGKFPKEERYGLTSQVRRAASSIGANIAEGTGRAGNGDFARFLHFALGSACELEYHLTLAKDLRLLPAREFQELSERTNEVKRMLTALIAKVRPARTPGA
jgi:four helix bundle protein